MSIDSNPTQSTTRRSPREPARKSLSAQLRRAERDLASATEARETAEKRLQQTQAVLADTLTGNVEPLWSVRLSELDEDGEGQDIDELLIRARSVESVLAVVGEQCRFWADGWEARDYTAKVWRVIDGTGHLKVEAAGEYELFVESLCRNCQQTEDAHDQRPLPADCCGTYFLSTEQRVTVGDGDAK